MIDCVKCVHFSICTCANDGKDECVYYEPERPHGEWIKADRRTGFRFQEGLYICSLCENVVAVEECIAEPIYNFCPHCGAPMTEEALREYNGLKEGEAE